MNAAPQKEAGVGAAGTVGSLAQGRLQRAEERAIDVTGTSGLEATRIR